MTTKPRSGINIERQPTQARLNELGVFDWSIWTKEVSEFSWTYDVEETCYFLEGYVVVTPDGGEPVEMGKGDLVTFPAGMSCTWKIRRDVKKHYSFG
ncbi:MAG: cupin domain-containing protein [Hydrococcus sp. C42_A2020_068]|nr:cupin domain-containing protein [Hydrococcus sp. C42_A2020_068]